MATARKSRSLAAFVGRSAAICAHPYAAWQVVPQSRLLMVSAYAVAAYVVVLGALLML